MDPNAARNPGIKLKKNKILFKLLKPFSLKSSIDIPAVSGDQRGIHILECIKSAQDEWLDANRNFEYADDDEIIDYYIYRIKASEIKYAYYLKKAKDMGIKTDNFKYSSCKSHTSMHVNSNR